ncbi:hypothetical protein COT62_03050 [Candidatus Roizmanbacteria bacterium CG09_land_8_20_14_0_10_41_9]|uniref:Methyltransferase type 11 domain-containing protein n=1 Tax=Candidatus Roizmanbacteria bacterium CG09_land_8_20_14_0_10_41_9 TaxID=1974850 RepID=A0A2H0WSF9_9BACT|nr:MAG: hypothetical protein COT62_03050 [Candidatus Roizmanbacteria bacterium CG09_land_8_20_14_0_10_41_9]
MERNDTEKGFVMVEPPTDKTGFIKTELGHMMGRPLKPEDMSEAQVMNTLWKTFDPSLGSAGSYRQYVAFEPTPNAKIDVRIRRGSIERSQRFLQLMEALNMEDIRWSSFGSFIPTYLMTIQEHCGRKQPEGPDAVSMLLVGAQSVDTVKEYNAAVKYIFPDAKPYVIDIEGEDTNTRLSVRGDGAQMPFKDNGFNMVMTNMLLHMLKVPAEPARSPKETRLVLFEEFFRVLKPGGTVCLVESELRKALGSGDIDQWFKELRQELKSAGFVGIQAEPTIAYGKRINMYKFLRANGKGSCIDPDDFRLMENVLTITAMKPDTQHVLQRLKNMF